jgi:hypothetical protein
MIELLDTIIVAGIGIFCGWGIARAKTFSDYNDMYSHLTCEIISRMTRAMRSLCMEQEDIDRVIQRMGCKLIPPACPPPPKPAPSEDVDPYIREQVERLFEENYVSAKYIYYIPNSDGGGIDVRIEGMKYILKEKDENVSDV